MTTIESRPQRQQAKPPSRRARVFGYLVAVTINVALIWLLNVAPGWRWLPFLSDDFTRVLGVVTLSLVVSVAVNLLYIGFDPPWMKRLGDTLTLAVWLVVTLQVLLVFPFDFGQWAGWETPFRALVVVGCLGAAIGVVANIVLLAREVVTGIQRS